MSLPVRCAKDRGRQQPAVAVQPVDVAVAPAAGQIAAAADANELRMIAAGRRRIVAHVGPDRVDRPRALGVVDAEPREPALVPGDVNVLGLLGVDGIAVVGLGLQRQELAQQLGRRRSTR